MNLLDKPLYDLIYAGDDVKEIILAKYPDAKMTDASDDIHPERFEVEIPNVNEDEFYPFAIKKGFAIVCFSFALLVESLKFPESKAISPKESKAKLEHWIKLAKSGEKDD